MNVDVIRKMAEVTLSGAMPFPEIVGNLIREGVEYYHADFVTLSFTFYSASGEVVAAPPRRALCVNHHLAFDAFTRKTA